MPVTTLGHVVLKVRDLNRSIPFYRDVLGFREVSRYGPHMAFLTLGANHHDLGLLELGPAAPSPGSRAVGLYHVAFKIGDSLEELRAFKEHLERHRVNIIGLSDHKVSQSIYFTDPDGIELEAYVDADPRIWQEDPAAVATVEPLDL
jgi:catechol 2,3-dioxygenase